MAKYKIGKKRKYTIKRRKYNKPRGNASNTIIRAPAAISDSTMVKMNYGFNVDTNSTTAPDAHIFNCNSIHDPDFSGVGHQPLSHDQWASFYTSYCVYAIRYDIQAVGITSGTSGQLAVVFKPNSTGVTDFDTIREKSYNQYKICGPPGSAPSVRQFKGYMTTKRMFGLKELTNADTSYQASFGSNPSNNWYLHCYSQAIDNSTSYNVYWTGVITYYVKLFNRKALTES